jgi:hypothetical protein
MVSHPHTLLAWELGWGGLGVSKNQQRSGQSNKKIRADAGYWSVPYLMIAILHGLYTTSSQQPAGSWLTGSLAALP